MFGKKQGDDGFKFQTRRKFWDFFFFSNFDNLFLSPLGNEFVRLGERMKKKFANY